MLQIAIRKSQVTHLAALLLVAALFTGVASAQQPGSSQQDFIGRSLQLQITDAPQQVQGASVSRTGNPGPNTYYYWIVTQGVAGASSPAGPYVAQQSAGTLSGSQFNTIAWTPVSNAVSYDVLRTTSLTQPSGACSCAVATAVTLTSTTDQSNSLNSYTVSALDPSQFVAVMTNESLTTSRSQAVLRAGGNQMFAVGMPPANFIGGDYYRKYTAIGSGLQIPSDLIFELDAYRGGQETQVPATGTKTQWTGIRGLMYGRTLGEKHGVRVDLSALGKGDNIPIHGLANDYGGFYSLGSEGSDGGRFMTMQGDTSQNNDGVPIGTVASVAGNAVTLTLTNGTANLGEQRPLINTSRAVYSTGSISSVIGSGSPVVCTVTGAATGWTALGAGAHSDLFLNITGNDGTANGNVRFVVPIISITDNTHLIIEYNQAEVNQSCFGSTLVASGAYNIYHGGTVTSLADPPAGSMNPSAVNLNAGGSAFVAGDSVEQPVGYNYHGVGVMVVLSRVAGEQNGGGVRVVNATAPLYRDGYRATGNFQHGLLFDAGVGGTGLSLSGIQFDEPVAGGLIVQTDASATNQILIEQALTLGGSLRRFNYNRASDRWDFLAVPVNAAAGFMYNGTAANGNCLVGNGTAFVSAACPGGGSGTPGGGVGTVQYQVNGTTFGGVLNSLVDNSTDASAANRAMMSLTNTYTNSGATFSAHLLDLNCNSASAAAMNTLACAYLTLKNNNTAGALGHPIGLAIRFSDNSTGSATIGLSLDGLYVEANNAAGTTGVGTIPELNDINLANATLSSTSQTISNFNGLKYVSPIMGANTIVTRETAINLGAIRATTAQVVTSQLINAGGCTDTGVYVPAVFCGGRVDIQTPILQTGLTLDTASIAPQTAVQLYGLKQSTFVSTNVIVTNVTSLLTGQTGNTGATMVGADFVVDNGGNGTPTLDAVFRAQLKNSGGGVVTEGVNYLALTPQNSSTYTDTTGFKCNDLTAATQTNTPQCFKQLGASIISTFAGPLFWNGNRIFVASDFTTDGTTNLLTITGLTKALPVNTAENVSLNCAITYQQNVGTAAVSFGIVNSVAPTQETLSGGIQVAANSTEAWSILTGLNTTTATAIMTGTPGAITTLYTAHITGFIENPSGAANTFGIVVKTATGADTVTVKRDSYCVLGG